MNIAIHLEVIMAVIHPDSGSDGTQSGDDASEPSPSREWTIQTVIRVGPR